MYTIYAIVFPSFRLAEWICFHIEFPRARLDRWSVFDTAIQACTNHLIDAAGFDTSVHISEEARNAPTAVPFAIMSATILSSVLGWSTFSLVDMKLQQLTITCSCEYRTCILHWE